MHLVTALPDNLIEGDLPDSTLPGQTMYTLSSCLDAGGASIPIRVAQLPKIGSSCGIIILELYGGMLSGLSAALASGYHVDGVHLVENDEETATVALHHFSLLRSTYPSLLRATFVSRTLPQDVSLLTAAHLLAADLHLCKYLLVFCGWPCQRRSPAGAQQGTAPGVVRHFCGLLSTLDRLRLGQRGTKSLAYIVENTSVGPSAAEAVRRDQAEVVSFLGKPLHVDEARWGPTHRERDLWTNLTRLRSLATVIDLWKRDPAIDPQAFLDPHRALRHASASDNLGAGHRYPCSTIGGPLKALPTLVSRHRSYAFRGTRDGVILDHRYPPASPLHTCTPSAAEGERLLGFLPGSTAASTTLGYQFTDAQRCAILGRSFAQHTFVAVLVVARLLRRRLKSLAAQKGDAFLHFIRASHDDSDTATLCTLLPGNPLLAPDPTAALERLRTHLLPRLAAIFAAETGIELLPTQGRGGGTADVQPEPPPPEPPPPLVHNVGDESTPESCKRQMQALLAEFPDCFSTSKADIGCIKEEFESGVDPHLTSLWSAKRKMPQAWEPEFLKIVTELALYGITVEAPDATGFASPILMVPKKDTHAHLSSIKQSQILGVRRGQAQARLVSILAPSCRSPPRPVALMHLAWAPQYARPQRVAPSKFAEWLRRLPPQ
jgi:hypothetical protein